jgi:hypothetical protein
MDGKAMEINYNIENSGHENSFEVGNEFQDFVCMKLAEQNIILQNINSKKFQYETGENLQGFEIKYDARCTGDKGTIPTNRLSIEIAEKTKTKNIYYVPSGIYRGDNAWIYIQGNYMMFWILSVKHLRLIYETGKYPKYELPTIQKFYLPIELADKYCIKKFIFT